MKTYFQHINEGIRTTLSGMKLTLKHLWDARRRRSHNDVAGSGYFNEQNGMVTLQYPFETMPIPDNGRYRLHNEMNDCIVCDKCAKVCPVDCIDIEPIKATGEVGKASDGSPIRLYAAKFDIDMAKCCYCGLCTTVCPTECLTMTKTFDYSEFDVRDMNYHYANLTPEQAEEKKALYEQFVKEKEELKKSQQSAVGSSQSADQYAVAAQPVAGGESTSVPTPKPAFRPTVKPTIPKTEEIQASENTETPKPKPVFAPKKPAAEAQLPSGETPSSETVTPKPKPVFAPKKPAVEAKLPSVETPSSETVTPKPKPVFAPKKPAVEAQLPSVETPSSETVTPKPKPVFVPKKPVSTQSAISGEPPTEDKTNKKEAPIGDDTPRGMGAKPKPVFKPTMKPKKEE